MSIMTNIGFYFIKENWGKQIDFLTELKRELPDTKILSIAEFYSRENLQEITNNNSKDIIIAVQNLSFTDFKVKLLQDSMFYDKGFKFHYVNICFDNNPEEIKKLKSAKYSFIYAENAEPAVNAINLKTSLNLLKLNIITDLRLSEYIKDSFQDIVDSEMLKKKNDEIRELNAELEKLSQTDTLTQLYNRNALYKILENERKRTERDIWRYNNSTLKPAEPISPASDKFEDYRRSEPKGNFKDHVGIFSVLMIDIDFFKQINDTQGHLMGDEVLKVLGKILQDKNIFRPGDISARFGGEEFIVILPETSAKNAVIPANKIYTILRNTKFTAEDGDKFQITISTGISEYKTTDIGNDDIIGRADKALYYAKENGRNKIILYEDIFD